MKTNHRKRVKTERGTKTAANKAQGSAPTPASAAKPPRRKPQNKLEKKPSVKTDAVSNLIMEDSISKQQAKTGHMTPEEVERHLESRR